MLVHLQLFLGLVYFSVEELPKMNVVHVGLLDWLYNEVIEVLIWFQAFL